MAWIKTIPFDAATGKLRALYKRVTGPNSNVDNIMMMHSLRPHTMEGHMAIYKYVLHHKDNAVPKWFLETLGVWVSSLNTCSYCVEHHFAGLKRLLRDDVRADGLRAAIEARDIAEAPLDGREQEALRYAQKLTVNPADLVQSDVQALRDAGWEDGEILEINQVSAYFSYANRTVLGLGCSTQGDVIGLSPGNNDDPDDWGHA
ncbi:peroxidase-related enzyme [Sulfitobacter sp. M57]|uniref:carboxymuconolactone decarboxylase family protein n=1 Tax=unclassified Sulfitobacter TaxID=196795 RepID=UPI0023E2716D|nr:MULTISPECIES: peroxidase-related enzyme [unclassified Sulfitobacter]MDF3413091.1 peroxidase-related enzyme [Sulfitobacter sp. KE5]MDF3421626.1 peroxidase-related enzyme [Sulfitobacter sp. KE43]MDF3431640.1 peroxidase-related enzyme [Sulfitobacter sp. KE42]MDF3457281.1 peroxidase-related enzyme [Sulfitobacter sp. S74]MDF3461183.1 peroxidase-related enzyme [Sulfitobacter sp. Ks18]